MLATRVCRPAISFRDNRSLLGRLTPLSPRRRTLSLLVLSGRAKRPIKQTARQVLVLFELIALSLRIDIYRTILRPDLRTKRLAAAAGSRRSWNKALLGRLWILVSPTIVASKSNSAMFSRALPIGQTGSPSIPLIPGTQDFTSVTRVRPTSLSLSDSPPTSHASASSEPVRGITVTDRSRGEEGGVSPRIQLDANTPKPATSDTTDFEVRINDTQMEHPAARGIYDSTTPDFEMSLPLTRSLDSAVPMTGLSARLAGPVSLSHLPDRSMKVPPAPIRLMNPELSAVLAMSSAMTANIPRPQLRMLQSTCTIPPAKATRRPLLLFATGWPTRLLLLL